MNEILRTVKSGNEEYYAWIGWCVADIKMLKPTWTKEKCIRFLEDWGDPIIEQMVEAGWNAIHEALREEE